ncbi:MAG: ArsR family transcriptional regulator [Methanocellales archaeon]|nr:ArsR family transcriptional regulator [Methanocellales archaeon]
MKKLSVSILDDKDEEFANILMDIGLNRNVARTLIYLANADEVTSRSIELGANLRQPEVSIAMRQLRDKNWVVEREIKKEGKGRPLKCYKLSVPIQDIITHLEETKRKQAEKDLESIERLRKLSPIS